MPTLITDLTGTTELEAVNAMLGAIGEAPLPTGTDLSASPHPDVQTAIGVLTATTREVLSTGWRFNTEFGYELSPAAQFTWTDSASVSTELNIFVPPAGLAGFQVTPTAEQQGTNEVDTEIRRSRVYSSVSPVLVFADRRRARDGFPSADHPYLYIDPIWYLDFEDLPEVARRYVFTKAGRTFVEGAIGSQTLSRFTQRDEQIALRALVREHGLIDRASFLSDAELHNARGRRPGFFRGVIDPRRNRGYTP
jgi:hypothetical protein